MAELPEELREFVESLTSNNVDFLIVGAFALAFHGYTRFTGDLDILVRPTPKNIAALRAALDAFGFASLKFDEAAFIKPDKMLTFGVYPKRIDVLNQISGLTFDEAWESRVEGPINGATVFFIGYDALVANKSSTGRIKDQQDIDRLASIKKAGEKHG